LDTRTFDRDAHHVWSGIDAETRGILEDRLGHRYSRQRLGIEKDHEARIAGRRLNFFHTRNLRSSRLLISAGLRAACIYGVARRNAARVELRHNEVHSALIPLDFSGFRILHLSDLHADISQGAMARITELVSGLEYDLCVLTGDYRGETFGPIEPTLEAMSRLRSSLKGPTYAVLGNHDTILMVPALERIGIRMLMNEAVTIERGSTRIHLGGIDDANFYRVDNIEKAALGLPHDEFSILLSHTPEIYRQAAHADFNLLLSGHTHGGQICLPGGIPMTLAAVLPRRMGRGAWTYSDMAGYTSAGAGTAVLPVRLSCPAEITLHHLCPAPRWADPA
jgi:predicted MPP superfamily phosphohydrolase